MPSKIDPQFWDGRRVFMTGHTGFKGGWLLAWLRLLGARVSGFAQPPATTPSLFAALAGAELCEEHVEGDIRNLAALSEGLQRSSPEIVFHLAAQSLVRFSYRSPVETFSTNIMGTVNLIEACRQCPDVRAIVIVTTDKCYENREWTWSYRENDPLGGRDPYSASKASAEIVTAAYRESFFGGDDRPAVASARAGNVFGGGDWNEDRLLPDAVRAFHAGEPLVLRHPEAVRPWQFVLEPLAGYLMLAQACHDGGHAFARSYNFGPRAGQVLTVEEVARRFAADWGADARCEARPEPGAVHEAGLLLLDSGLANRQLGWVPQLDLEDALAATAHWYRSYYSGEPMRALTLSQIERYGGAAGGSD